MSDGLKLYAIPNHKNGYKVLITAQYAGVSVETPPYEHGVDNKKPEFFKLNPHGKVPVLDTPQGGIWESNAIARYLARMSDSGLFGSTPIETARIEQWIEFSTHDIDAPLQSWVLPVRGRMPYDKKKEDAAKEAVKKALGVLNDHLKTQTYLVGDAVTLADIITFCNLIYGFAHVFGPEMQKEFPCVTRYFVTLAHQPQFKAVVGDMALATEEQKYVPPKKEEKKKEEKKKEAPKPKETPAAAAPADAADEEEEKPAPKPKDPMSLLPPTPMALDSWKRLYSNTPGDKFREIAIAGLWSGADVPNSPTNEHFVGYDPEGYTMYFCDYKYTDENTVNYVVMNKVGGFLQRIDYVRKHAFGVMCILKNEKGEFPIRGIWIFRGPGIPQIMLDECYDMELYDWVKADINDPEQKKRIEDMIAEEATIDGLENVECKVFK